MKNFNTETLMSTLTVKCPTCQKDVPWTEASKTKPFCSDRCKLIDLGAWASEEHSIPGDPSLDDPMSSELFQ
jgi:endogenous inhibitor of DNA gyrase (YacG/DUF329 family)